MGHPSPEIVRETPEEILALLAAPPRNVARERLREPPPALPAQPSSGPPEAFIYALILAVLFLLGFVIWRMMRPGQDTRPPPTSSVEVVRPTPPTRPDVPPPTTAIPPATSQRPATTEPPQPTTESSPAAAEGSFGATRANHEAPPAGSGWLLAAEGVSGWTLEDGRVLEPGTPVSASLGVHAVMHGRGETVRVRYVRVRADATRVLPAL